MKNIMLALAIALGFCVTEAVAQTSTRQRRSLLGGRNRPAAAVYKQPDIILFDAQKAMPYADAVENAKENDPEAYYWLSYYFADGKIVNMDYKVAWKFLLKAEELGCPEACRTIGRIHEFWIVEEEKNNLFPYALGMLDCAKSGLSGNDSLTNVITITRIESFYINALNGGLLDATNDLVRLRKKMIETKARIEKEERQIAAEKRKMEMERLKAKEEKLLKDELTAQALALLPADKLKESNERAEREAREAEEIRKIKEEKERVEREEKEAKDKAERMMWFSWPNVVKWSDAEIVLMCEEERNVSFHGRWTQGCGKCYIEGDGTDFYSIEGKRWKKWNVNGELVCAGPRECFEEYIWMTNVAPRVMLERQTKWAEEHEMSLDEAKNKHEEFLKKNGSVNNLDRSMFLGGRSDRSSLWGGRSGGRGLGSLRERRAQRDAERAQAEQAAEKAAREESAAEKRGE